MNRRNTMNIGLAVIGGFAVIGPAFSQLAFGQQPAAKQAPAQEHEGLEVLQLRPNFFMIAGAGGNIAVQVGDLGAVLVDTGLASMASQVLAEVK